MILAATSIAAPPFGKHLEQLKLSRSELDWLAADRDQVTPISAECRMGHRLLMLERLDREVARDTGILWEPPIVAETEAVHFRARRESLSWQTK